MITDTSRLHQEWPYKSLGSFNIHEVWKAVDNDEWQRIRKGMKGTTTEAKLHTLVRYLDVNAGDEGVDKWADLSWEVRCRVQNYIGALKRGGQLSIEGKIQR